MKNLYDRMTKGFHKQLKQISCLIWPNQIFNELKLKILILKDLLIFNEIYYHFLNNRCGNIVHMLKALTSILREI